MVRYSREDYAAALPLFEKAARTWTADGTYAYFTALCKMRLGRFDEAIAGLEASLPPAPVRVPGARIRHDLGEARYLSGDRDGAEREFQSALSLDDQDAWSHYFLGLIRFGKGDAAGAVQEFERAVALEPALAGDGSYYLGIAAHERGEPDAAREHFETAMGSAAGSGVAASSRGWLESEQPAAVAPAPPPGEIRVTLLAEYDDNPGQLNNAFVDALTLLGVDPDTIDSDVRGDLEIRAGWQPFVRQDGWTLGLVVNGYGSRHDGFEFGDMTGGQALFQAAWGADPLAYVNGPLEYARVSPGRTRFGWVFQGGSTYFDRDETRFRRDHELAASFLVREGRFGKTQMDLQYADRTYFDFALSVLTGDVSTARIGQYFQLGRRPDRYVRPAVARSSFHLDAIDFYSTQYLAEAALPLGRRWTAFLYGSRTRGDHIDPDSDLTEASGTAVFAFTRHAYATLRYGWVDYQGGAATTFDYDRHTGAAGITWYW